MYNTILTYLEQQGIQDAERHATAITELLIQPQSLPPTPQYDIIRGTLRAVCIGFHVTVTAMMSYSRRQPLPMARHAYYYLCRYYPKTKVTLSEEAVAGVIDKDHASCQHGYKTVEAYLQTNDKEFMPMWEKTLSQLSDKQWINAEEQSPESDTEVLIKLQNGKVIKGYMNENEVWHNEQGERVMAFKWRFI